MSTDTDSDPDASTIDQLAAELDALRTRVDDLETECDRKDDRIAALESRFDAVTEARTTTEARLDAHERKLDANKARIAELQSRELEKGAHLPVETVDESAISVADGRLERIRKDDGNRYFRLPDHEDPIDRGGSVTLAHADLLPIQQLARMDPEMRRSTTSALPTRLAAKLWQARTDPAVGDTPWKQGSQRVRESVTASDLKHWIRRQEDGVSDTYAKKLVTKTIDAILELSKHRLAVSKRTQRKNGLEYTERRLVLPVDSAIPGERSPARETPSAKAPPSPGDS